MKTKLIMGSEVQKFMAKSKISVLVFWTKVALLFPWLVLQAAYVKFKVPVLPEAKGKRDGRVGDKPQFNLMLLGDSAAAGVGVFEQKQALIGRLVEQLQNDYKFNWQLSARSGATTSDINRWLDEMPTSKIDIVIVSLGVNDVINAQLIESWILQQNRLVKQLRSKFSTQLIVFSEVPSLNLFPALPYPLRHILGERAHQFNFSLSNWIKSQKDCELVNIGFGSSEAECPQLALANVNTAAQYMASDGFHPGDKGYQVWAESLHKILKQKITQA